MGECIDAKHSWIYTSFSQNIYLCLSFRTLIINYSGGGGGAGGAAAAEEEAEEEEEESVAEAPVGGGGLFGDDGDGGDY